MATVNNLKIKKYVVNKLSFILNETFASNKKSIEVFPEFDRKIKSINENEFTISLSVKIKKDLQKNDIPFYAEIKITGYYHLINWKNDGNYDFGVDVGTNILFPYLRSLLSSLVSSGNFPPYVLPVTNTKILFEDFESGRTLEVVDKN